MPIHPSVCLLVHFSVYLSVCLSVCLSLFVFLSVCLSLYVCVSLSVCFLSVLLCMFVPVLSNYSSPPFPPLLPSPPSPQTRAPEIPCLDLLRSAAESFLERSLASNTCLLFPPSQVRGQPHPPHSNVELINPRCMRREGYCSCRVCLSVCLLFDNSLHEWLFASKTNTHIQRRMEVKKYVGFSLKLLRSRVMASFTPLE